MERLRHISSAHGAIAHEDDGQPVAKENPVQPKLEPINTLSSHPYRVGSPFFGGA